MMRKKSCLFSAGTPESANIASRQPRNFSAAIFMRTIGRNITQKSSRKAATEGGSPAGFQYGGENAAFATHPNITFQPRLVG